MEVGSSCGEAKICTSQRAGLINSYWTCLVEATASRKSTHFKFYAEFLQVHKQSKISKFQIPKV